MARKRKGDFIDMQGVSELLKKIEKANGNVNDAVKKCVENSLEQVGMKMQLFMMSHKLTGTTYESFELMPVQIKDGNVNSIIGYNIKKGGLPAIFLDVGTPKIKPHFFRYYAIENSRPQLKEIQQATLNEILEGLL